MTRALPESATLVLVTPLLLLYGSTDWSWVAGPVAALAIWALDLGRRVPASSSAPPRVAVAEPEPVD